MERTIVAPFGPNGPRLESYNCMGFDEKINYPARVRAMLRIRPSRFPKTVIDAPAVPVVLSERSTRACQRYADKWSKTHGCIGGTIRVWIMARFENGKPAAKLIVDWFAVIDGGYPIERVLIDRGKSFYTPVWKF